MLSCFLLCSGYVCVCTSVCPRERLEVCCAVARQVQRCATVLLCCLSCSKAMFSQGRLLPSDSSHSLQHTLGTQAPACHRPVTTTRGTCLPYMLPIKYKSARTAVHTHADAAAGVLYTPQQACQTIRDSGRYAQQQAPAGLPCGWGTPWCFFDLLQASVVRAQCKHTHSAG
jgi:hypothetical protein